jgi:serine/threonine protein kinase
MSEANRQTATHRAAHRARTAGVCRRRFGASNADNLQEEAGGKEPGGTSLGESNGIRNASGPIVFAAGSHLLRESGFSALIVVACSLVFQAAVRKGAVTISPMSVWTEGATLGPYILLSRVGAGGMGEVWKARDPRLERVVAIKRWTGRPSPRFQHEARAIAALNHPHICHIYDVGPDYLVMEYIDGEPLAGPKVADEAVRLAIQIAAAIEEAHARGILHRDLKPGNILVTTKGSVKLLDFGLAKLLSPDEPSASLTADGSVMGTPAYMSPEQARGNAVDERSDVFSFGAVLYELLSGRRAFGGSSSAEIISSVLRDEPSALSAPHS